MQRPAAGTTRRPVTTASSPPYRTVFVGSGFSTWFQVAGGRAGSVVVKIHPGLLPGQVLGQVQVRGRSLVMARLHLLLGYTPRTRGLPDPVARWPQPASVHLGYPPLNAARNALGRLL